MTLRYYIYDREDGPVEVTDRIWTALEWNSSAEELNAVQSEWVVEDPDSDIVIFAWQRVWVQDDEAPEDNQVIGMGSIADVHVKRSEVFGRSPTCRAWHLTITDLNYAMHTRLFEAEDSPSRPDETDLERVDWFMGTGSAILVNSATDYIDTTGGVALDAYDWLTQSQYDMLNGAEEQSGRNAFVLYDETKGTPDFETPENGELQLWYAKTGSDLWASTLTLTNDASIIDPDNGIFPLAEDDLDLHLDPTRIFWKLVVAYDGGSTTVSDLDIATVYTGRETTLDASDLTSAVTAAARGNRMLQQGSTPAVRIQWGYHCQSDHVNALLAGQSFTYRATHLGNLPDGVPDFAAGVTLRSMDRTVVEKSQGNYYVSGTAVPPTPSITPGEFQFTEHESDNTEPNAESVTNWPVTPGVGSLLLAAFVLRAGDTDATTWPSGWVEIAKVTLEGDGVGFIGGGTATLRKKVSDGAPDASLVVHKGGSLYSFTGMVELPGFTTIVDTVTVDNVSDSLPPTPSIGPITATADGQYAIGFAIIAGIDDTITLGGTPDWVEMANGEAGASPTMTFAYKLLENAESATLTATSSTVGSEQAYSSGIIVVVE